MFFSNDDSIRRALNFSHPVGKIAQINLTALNLFKNFSHLIVA